MESVNAILPLIVSKNTKDIYSARCQDCGIIKTDSIGFLLAIFLLAAFLKNAFLRGRSVLTFRGTLVLFGVLTLPSFTFTALSTPIRILLNSFRFALLSFASLTLLFALVKLDMFSAGLLSIEEILTPLQWMTKAVSIWYGEGNERR